MDTIELDAEPRETGKKASRAIRRNENVPCVLYGRDVENVFFQVPALDLRPLIYADATHRVEVTLNGDSWECIMKDIDFDPVSDQPQHVDFQVLLEGEEIKITVPLRFEGVPFGQTEGGDTQLVQTELDVRCLPKDIPDAIEVDISELDIGESIHVEDLEEEGVTFLAQPRQTLVTVVPPTVLELEPEAPEAEEVSEEEEAELAEAGEVADTAEAETEAEAEGEADEEFEEDL
jgi:large subunit ribosomal protein L25